MIKLLYSIKCFCKQNIIPGQCYASMHTYIYYSLLIAIQMKEDQNMADSPQDNHAHSYPRQGLSQAQGRLEQFQPSLNPCLQNISKFHHGYISVGNWICSARVLSIFFIYYLQAYTITHEAPYNIDPSLYHAQDESQLIEPWNLMIYFLSATVDLLYLIGYISVFKMLNKEANTATKAIRQSQQAYVNCQEALQQAISPNKQHPQQQQQQLLCEAVHIHKLQAEQIRQQSHFIMPEKITSFKVQYSFYRSRLNNNANNNSNSSNNNSSSCVYNSLYSTLLAYKYRFRDLSSAFRMGQIMHIVTTFLIFGSFALQKQGELQPHDRRAAGEQSDTFYTSYLHSLLRQALLWVFLLSAYIHAFELDAYGVQASTGPHIKIKHLHWSKVKTIYGMFYNWRQAYHRKLRLAMAVGVTVVVASLFYNIVSSSAKQQLPQTQNQEGENGVVHIFPLSMQIVCLALAWAVYKNNANLVQAVERRQTNNYNINFANANNGNNESNVILPEERWYRYLQTYNRYPSPSPPQNNNNNNNNNHIKNEQYQFIYHPCLSMYGILNTTTPNTITHKLGSAYRVAILVLLMAHFRNPAPSAYLTVADYGLWGLLAWAEYTKIRDAVACKYNLLPTYVYADYLGYRNNRATRQKYKYALQQQNGRIQLKIQNKQQQRQSLMTKTPSSQPQANSDLQFRQRQRQRQRQGSSSERILTHNINQNSNQEIDEEDRDHTCSICLMDYGQGDTVVVLHCGHVFHEPCMQSWMAQKKECPLDRTPIDDYIDFQ